MDFATTSNGRRQSPEERDPYSSPTQSIRERHWQQRQRQRSIDHHYLNTSVNIATAFAEEARRQTSPRVEKHRITSTRLNSLLDETPKSLQEALDLPDISSPGEVESFWSDKHSDSDVDPLEELDAFAQDLDEDDLEQQYDLLQYREKDSYETPKPDDSSNDSNNDKQHDDLRINTDRTISPVMRPFGEVLYEIVAFGLFLIVYAIKEVVLAMVAYADMVACALIVNTALCVLHCFRLMRHKEYVSPLRMLRRRKQSQPIFQIAASAIYLWIFYALLYHQQPTTIVRYSNLRNSLHGFVNHNIHHNHHYPTSEDNTDTIRATVERILSGIVPPATNGKQMDFITGLQTYLNDHYVQRTELNEQHVPEQPAIVPAQKEQQLADFALATRGARIIPKMTSATYSPHNRQSWKSTIAQAFGIHPGSYRPSPLIALLPETHVGQCWPMEGRNGTLGIVMSEPISIKSVSMEYPTKELTSNTSSAPQEFEVWGLRQIKVPAFTGVQWPWLTDDTDAKYLGTFRYDTRVDRSVQTFNVNSEEGTFEGVIFRILSNWGHDSYTCLYRARVHGMPSV